MSFHDDLKRNAHYFVKGVYRLTRKFPKQEMYGVVSQLRRAALSVILNYIEGFARKKGPNCKVYINFLEISYGSLREARYLIYFSYTEKYITEAEYNKLFKLADTIGAMLWGIISSIKK